MKYTQLADHTVNYDSYLCHRLWCTWTNSCKTS